MTEDGEGAGEAGGLAVGAAGVVSMLGSAAAVLPSFPCNTQYKTILKTMNVVNFKNSHLKYFHYNYELLLLIGISTLLTPSRKSERSINSSPKSNGNSSNPALGLGRSNMLASVRLFSRRSPPQRDIKSFVVAAKSSVTNEGTLPSAPPVTPVGGNYN